MPPPLVTSVRKALDAGKHAGEGKPCYRDVPVLRFSIADMVIRFRFNFLLYLTAILVALKVLEIIDWPWGWILAPLWMPVAIVLGVAAVGFCFAATFLAKLGKSFGRPAGAGREEIVINGDRESAFPDAHPPRQIGNVYDHEQP